MYLLLLYLEKKRNPQNFPLPRHLHTCWQYFGFIQPFFFFFFFYSLKNSSLTIKPSSSTVHSKLIIDSNTDIGIIIPQIKDLIKHQKI
jgi:hypothetical protein